MATTCFSNSLLTINLKIEKNEVLKLISNSSIKVLWDAILELQVMLYANKEVAYIDSFMPWWRTSKNLLDVGSGNGAYTSYLAETYSNKYFHGIEINDEFVEIASKRHTFPNLAFSVGDIHKHNIKLANKYDVVLLHIVLQHLTDTDITFSNIHNYLKLDGKLIIVDFIDELRSSSIKSDYLDSIFHEINHKNHKVKIDRKASLKIMDNLNDSKSKISRMFNIEDSNISIERKMISDKQILFNSDRDKELLFAQKLVFFQLWKIQYGLSVSLEKIYDIYKQFVFDENSFLSEGLHILVLKKI